MASPKLLIVLTTIFSLITFSSPIGIFYLITLMDPFLLKYRVRETCPENSTSWEEYEEVYHNASNCFCNLGDTSLSMCDRIVNNIQTCSLPLIDFFEDCLPEETKDMPKTIVKLGSNLVETVCSSTGGLLIEGINGCIYKYPRHFERDELDTYKEECSAKVLFPKLKKLAAEGLPPKSKACKIGRQVGNCWLDQVKVDCGPSSKATEFFLTFYNASISVCDEEQDLELLTEEPEMWTTTTTI